MDIKVLECFCAAYETHSFAQAAASSFFSRQAVGKMIKSLESELSVSLFVRDSSGVQPTAIADEIYPLSLRIVELYEGVIAAAEKQNFNNQLLSIAVARGVSNTISQDIFPEFTAQNPDIRLDVSVADSLKCEIMVKEGLKELALSTAPVESEHLISTSLMKEPLYLYGSTALLDKNGSIRKGSHLFLMSRTFKLDKLFLQEQTKLVDGLIIEDDLGDYDRIVENVKMGMGVCVGPACYLPITDQRTMFRLPIESKQCCWEIILLQREDAQLSQPAQQFFEYLTNSRLVKRASH